MCAFPVGDKGSRKIPARTVVGLVMTAAGSSWEQSRTAYLRPGSVAVTTGEGGDAKKDGARGTKVTMCPVTPPTATQASDTREASQPGDGPYCDDSERLAGSNDGLPETRSSGDGCWRRRGCGGGKSAGELGTRVPDDHTTAANASGSREASQPSDGPYCDGSERLGWSNHGLPQTRSSGNGYWRGEGCSGGRSAGELGMEMPADPQRRHTPVVPAKQASLAMDPAMTRARDSLGPTTASLTPGPVATAAGEGRDAVAAKAQENWVQRCLVAPLR